MGVSIDDDQLVITLTDGRTVLIPLQLVGQLDQGYLPSNETQLLILRDPPQIDHVHVTDTALNVYLKDGRLLSCPLAWFPRLLHGTPAERNHYELSGDDNVIHWPQLDEDIELTRLFEGGRSVEGENSWFYRFLLLIVFDSRSRSNTRKTSLIHAAFSTNERKFRQNQLNSAQK